MSKRAVFPGSFDPFTLGHEDIVLRSLQFFDSIVIGVLDNPDKKSLFSTEERVRLIQDHFKDHEAGARIQVDSFSGLLVEFANQKNASIIVRGLRAISDFDYEAQMALMNRKLSGTIETFFLMSSERFSYVSSTLVKQVAPFGGDVSGLVPVAIDLALKKKLAPK
ncbi:MAG: pantetheine-phosphate adenylyltransferase [Bdellovibrionales bacterium]|nr:pantetheine-phosphate adenylyltransferase [Bdellovibrionales bacterium]